MRRYIEWNYNKSSGRNLHRLPKKETFDGKDAMICKIQNYI
nr:MAG TPA: hypothetical protein [Caudoviricetes sp.]